MANRRRTRVMAIVLVLAGCRERGCSDTAVEHDTDGSEESGEGGESGDPDAITCGGAIEIVIVADDSLRDLQLGAPVAFDVRAVYETGHFGLLEDVEFSTDDDARLRVDAEGVLMPLSEGTVTVTANACDMETSIDVKIHAGMTPSQEILCKGWRDAIETAAADHEPCFSEPIPEPDCATQDAEHDAAFEVFATCVTDGEPECDGEQEELDLRFADLEVCVRTMTLGDLDCGPTLAFAREQCTLYGESACVASLAAPTICG